MNDEKIFEFVIEIKEKLSAISTSVDGIRDMIKNHENRLQALEGAGPQDLKHKLIEFLGKALIGAIAIIAALTGAGGILQGFTK